MPNTLNYKDVFLNALNLSPAGSTPLGKAPLSKEMNALLWKQINTDRTMTTQKSGDGGYSKDDAISDNGSFFVVGTFSGGNPSANTKLTGNLIYQYYISGLRFDEYGNLSVDGQDLTWNNPLIPGKPWNKSNKHDIFTKRYDTTVNSTGKWILTRDPVLSNGGNHTYYVLYNPIHTPAYKSYYNAEPDVVKRLNDSLPQKYCEIMADKNNNPLNGGGSPINTSSTVFQKFDYGLNPNVSYTDLPGDGNRNYADYTCNLMYNRECVNYPTGTSVSMNYPNYTELSATCDCAGTNSSPKLRASCSTGKNDSFLYTTDSTGKLNGGFVYDSHFQKSKSAECPTSLNIYNCTSNVTSAGNTTIQGSSTTQLCGVQPIDCKYSPSNIVWSECVGNSDGITGTQTATQTILQQAMGGPACDKDKYGSNANGTQITRTQKCTPNPIDCIMSAWKNEGTCSTTCGDGVQQQIRSILIEAAYGGKKCGEKLQNIPCNLGACPTPAPTTPAPTTPGPTTPGPTTPGPTTPGPTTPGPTTPGPTTAASSAASGGTPSGGTPESGSNTMLYVGAAVVVIGVGLYFYLSKKAVIKASK